MVETQKLSSERMLKHRKHLLPRWPVTKQPETSGLDVRKVFSTDLEHKTSPSVWSRRMRVRGWQGGPSSRMAPLPRHSTAPTPSPCDLTGAVAGEREQDPSTATLSTTWTWMGHLGLTRKTGKKLSYKVSSSRWWEKSVLHNTWLLGSVQENARYEHHLLYLSSYLWHFCCILCKELQTSWRMRGKKYKHSAIFPLLEFKQNVKSWPVKYVKS